MATPDEAVKILRKLIKELRTRQSDVELYEKAYRGDFKLTFASDDFRNFFENRYRNFSDNWCGIVADAPHERLQVTGIRLPDQTDGDDELWGDWLRNDCDALSDLAFLDAIVAKRSYALVWATPDDEPIVTWEHPSQAIVGYDPETRQRTAGAKMWLEEGVEYATLYLADEVWKFERPSTELARKTLDLPVGFSDEDGWIQRVVVGEQWPLPNPMGKVPLVEIPNKPRLVGEPGSDLAMALPMQHATNLFWAQLFAVSDEATMGQRVIIGAELPKIPIFNEAGDQIGERPIDLKKFTRDRALWLEDPSTKIDQWDPAKLDVFTDVIEIMVGHIAAQTRTPAHYLLIGGTIANVSGDAMKTLETGLVKRTEEKTQHFGRGIRDVFELIALARNENEKAKSIRSAEVLWKDVENRSDAQRADALLKKSTIGYPLRYLLELDGLSPEEVDRVMTMAREEATDPVIARLIGNEPTPPPDKAPVDADPASVV